MASGHPVVLIDSRASDALTDKLADETGIIALVTDEEPTHKNALHDRDGENLVPDWRDPQTLQTYSRKNGEETTEKEDRSDWAGSYRTCTSGNDRIITLVMFTTAKESPSNLSASIP